MIRSIWKVLPYFILARWLKSRSSADYATLTITSYGNKGKERKGKIKQFDNGEYLFIEDVSELLQQRSRIKMDLNLIEDKLAKYGE
jgi:hypothetical protein